MKIELINHACLRLNFNDGTKLLFDPWLFGYAFEQGWGLRYENPDWKDKVKDCTHLWISHFHDDHFHIPTLKGLFEINPDIVILGNSSFNFELNKAVARVGFKNIIPFKERTWLKLSTEVSVIRYPTTGIDNMLFIKCDDGTILNYNDCNLPTKARNLIAKKIGKVNVLLNNYNHAGKILDYPLPSSEQIQTDLIENFKVTVDTFLPDYTIPFASFHYYRAPESLDQNESMMNSDVLKSVSKTLLPLKVGEGINFTSDFSAYTYYGKSYELSPQPFTLKERNEGKSTEDLLMAAKQFGAKINKGFLYLTFWFPKLHIHISDLNQVVALNIFRATFIAAVGKPYHISAHSSELFAWWTKPYGTDAFIVGGHFDINQQQIFPLRFKLLIGLLTENKLDLKSFIKMAFTPGGIRFLYNRREEIYSILTSRNLNVGTRK